MDEGTEQEYHLIHMIETWAMNPILRGGIGRRNLLDGWGTPAPCGVNQPKEQQLLFLLVRQLAAAQFERADPVLSQRLWQEVAALDFDPDRVIHLLYGGQDPEDREALQALDRQWLEWEARTSRPRRRVPLWNAGWRRSALRPPAGGHRSAPPAVPQVHRSAN